jgi:hypothetical protein
MKGVAGGDPAPYDIMDLHCTLAEDLPNLLCSLADIIMLPIISAS